VSGLNWREKNDILVTCAPGLAQSLKDELQALGFEAGSLHPGGVGIAGSLTDAMMLNLVLRTAYNVLFLLREFGCGDPDALYRTVASIPWEEMIGPDEYVSVVSRVDTPSIRNTMYPNLKVKDAIVDRIGKKAGRRPNSGPERDNVVVQLFWKGERCWLYLNTSGRKLSDRGYRRISYKAPLREVLAAGVLMAAGYDGTMPLVLPMCGSGTLAVEAALIATNRAPGLLRSNFAFMHLKGFDAGAFGEIRSRLRKRARKMPAAPIIATDIEPEAIDVSRKNAMAAGVDRLIEFRVCDFADTPIPAGAGIVVLNPGYGERLGDIPELERTYRRIGDFFKKQCTGYTGYVFSGNRDLAKKIGLRVNGRTPFLNGAIKCTLLRFELYEGRTDARGKEKGEARP